MKEIKSKVKTSFFKKIFIKICRIFGFEIIDQSTFEVSTLSKSLNESLSVPGKKSIVVPLGEIKITRKIKSLTIIFRSCTNELIMDQNKKRLFEKDKNEYTFRSLNSLLKSVKNDLFPSTYEYLYLKFRLIKIMLLTHLINGKDPISAFRSTLKYLFMIR